MNNSSRLSKSTIIGIFCFVLFLGSIFSFCRRPLDERVIKLAHGLDITHPVHIAMEFMSERLKTKSGGILDVQIYPNQQLGDERQCLELLQIGSIGMTKVSAAVMEGFVPAYKVLSLPYIFRDREHSFQVLDGPVGRELLLQGEKFWLRGLGYYDAGSRSFYTKTKPIHSPADLKGLKIRVQSSNTSVNMIQCLGGAATPIAWGELYTALQGGVVDGAENNPPSFYLSHHYEVCKYYTLNEHTTIPDVLLIGKRIWDSLSSREKIWLQDAVDESINFQRKIWAEAEKEALRAVAAAGIEIIHPDKKIFADRVKAMYEAHQADDEIYAYIDRIRAYGQKE